MHTTPVVSILPGWLGWALQAAVSAITTGAQLFPKMDYKAGYHQLALREQDRDLKCFITPWEWFRYTWVPMDITHSGATYSYVYTYSRSGNSARMLTVTGVWGEPWGEPS